MLRRRPGSLSCLLQLLLAAPSCSSFWQLLIATCRAELLFPSSSPPCQFQLLNCFFKPPHPISVCKSAPANYKRPFIFKLLHSGCQANVTSTQQHILPPAPYSASFNCLISFEAPSLSYSVQIRSYQVLVAFRFQICHGIILDHSIAWSAKKLKTAKIHLFCKRIP